MNIKIIINWSVIHKNYYRKIFFGSTPKMILINVLLITPFAIIMKSPDMMIHVMMFAGGHIVGSLVSKKMFIDSLFETPFSITTSDHENIKDYKCSINHPYGTEE